MQRRVLSPKYWTRRVPLLLRVADRLKEEANEMTIRNEQDDRAYLRKKYKAEAAYREASTIILMLDTLEKFGNEETVEFLRSDRKEDTLEGESNESR